MHQGSNAIPTEANGDTGPVYDGNGFRVKETENNVGVTAKTRYY